MKLDYSECRSSGNILKDLARFNKVSEYLQAIVEMYKEGVGPLWETFEVHPIECGYTDSKTGEYMSVIECGAISPNAQRNINKLKRQSAADNTFISDNLVITADGFEGECFFSWE